MRCGASGHAERFLSDFVSFRQTNLERRGDAGKLVRAIGVEMQKHIESDHVRDHQLGHIDDRDRVRGAQLPRPAQEGQPAGVCFQMVVTRAASRDRARR